MFVERARDAHPGFELTDGDAEDVAEICVRLDGLPLAIELAAARIALFSPSELRDRLRKHGADLGGGTRDLPQRQQTLRSTIEWSERLLDEDERSTFRLFSVFATARIEAVEAVASRLDGGMGADVLPRLVSLVDKSLIRSLDEDGHRRLAMLETIRDYAAERLDELPEEREAVRRAHAEHFAEVAHERRERLTGSERAEVLADMEADLGNLRAAWRYWVEAGDLGRLDAMLDALWTLYDDRGWFAGRRPLERPALRPRDSPGNGGAHRPGDHGADEPGSRAHGDPRVHPGGRGHLRGRARSAQETGEPSDAVPLLRSLGSLYLYRGDFDKGIGIGRRLPRDRRTARGSGAPSRGASPTGDELRVARPRRRRPRPPRSRDRTLRPAAAGLGPAAPGRESGGRAVHDVSVFVLWAIGHPARAVERGAGALRIAAELHHPYTAAYALFHVAFLDIWRRDWASVHERHAQVREIAEEHDYQVWRALALIFLGVSEAALGRPAEGMALSDQGIARYQDLTTPPVFWPMVLSVRARGFGITQPEEGLEPVDQAIELMRASTTSCSPNCRWSRATCSLRHRVRATLEARSAPPSSRRMQPGPACGSSAPPRGSLSCVRHRVSRPARSTPLSRPSTPRSRRSPKRPTSPTRASLSWTRGADVKVRATQTTTLGCPRQESDLRHPV